MTLSRLRLYLVLAGLLLTSSNAALVRKELTLTWEQGAPNGQARDMIKTNGHFPSPNLVVDEDDDVEVTVHNHMHQNTTIHWHGLLYVQSRLSRSISM